MVNIYLFIELLHTANAMATVDALKTLQMQNCKFANVVALSDEKIVAQLDCNDSRDGDKAILNKIKSEILRPVFSLLDQGPLYEKCTFISYGAIKSLSEVEHLSHMNDSIVEEYEEYAEEA